MESSKVVDKVDIARKNRNNKEKTKMGGYNAPPPSPLPLPLSRELGLFIAS